jgi:hypothetical protein
MTKHKRLKRQEHVFAGFLGVGNRLATLDEVRNPSIATRSLGHLSTYDLQKLVLRRLRTNKNFLPLRMLGVEGVVGKTRAMAEVRTLSHVGQHLMEIEKRLIRLQLEAR